MKYSEYLQLDDILEIKGSNLRKELGITPVLNEAGEVEKPEVDTESGHWFTKWGRMKNKLNRAGKKHQKKLNDILINKFLPKMLTAEIQIIKLIAKALEDKKNPAEIKALLQQNLKKTQALQSQQNEIISKTIDKYLGNVGKQLNTKVDASKMSDENKMDLKNYWLLLQSQIQLNCLKFMGDIIQKKCDEAIGGNAEVKKVYDQVKKSGAGVFGILSKKNKEIKNNYDKYLKEVKDAEARAKAEEGKGDTKKGGAELIKDKKYMYTKTDKTQIEVTYKGQKDGKIVYEDKDGKIWNAGIDRKDFFKEIEPATTTDTSTTDTAGADKGEGERKPKL